MMFCCLIDKNDIENKNILKIILQTPNVCILSARDVHFFQLKGRQCWVSVFCNKS